MTNREMLIHTLSKDEFLSDGELNTKANIDYHIKCPYQWESKRALCHYIEDVPRKLCIECKLKWLDSEVDE